MEASNSGKGGKRIGAGRKPIGHDKKRQITLYVPEKSIWPFGTEEKLKESVYAFIEAKRSPVMSQEGVSAQISIQDLTKPTGILKPFEQPKTNYQIDTTPLPVTPITTRFEAYKAEILKSSIVPEVEAILKKAKADILTNKERQILEGIAKEHSKSMYTD